MNKTHRDTLFSLRNATEIGNGLDNDCDGKLGENLMRVKVVKEVTRYKIR